MRRQVEDTGEWIHRAACKGQDPELFELPDSWSPDTEKKLSKGLSFCAVCPVAQECVDWAENDDLKHTIRGGHMPGTFKHKGRPRLVDSDTSKMKPAANRTPITREEVAMIDAALLKGFCKNMHEFNGKWDLRIKRRLGTKSTVMCVRCERLGARRRRANAKKSTGTGVRAGSATKNVIVGAFAYRVR